MHLSTNKSTTIKVCILGNSAAIRTRPAASYPDNLNYTGLLRNGSVEREDGSTAIIQPVNVARGGNTVRSIFGQMNEILTTFPDFYIINLGVVDSCNREIPRWFFNLHSSDQQNWYNRFSRLVYNVIIRKIRRPLVFLRGKRSWVGPRAFNRLYGLLVERMLKETNAQIIGMSINIADDRVERALPGSRKKNLIYNEMIKSCMNQPRCQYLDLTDIPGHLFPDGVHFSSEGHKIVADRILGVINQMVD